jgi:hypothetical protein
MRSISPQEQYEVIRIILESKSENITVCKHESTNEYINILLKKLNIPIKSCLTEHEQHRLFDHHMAYNVPHQ